MRVRIHREQSNEGGAAQEQDREMERPTLSGPLLLLLLLLLVVVVVLLLTMMLCC